MNLKRYIWFFYSVNNLFFKAFGTANIHWIKLDFFYSYNFNYLICWIFYLLMASVLSYVHKSVWWLPTFMMLSNCLIVLIMFFCYFTHQFCKYFDTEPVHNCIEIVRFRSNHIIKKRCICLKLTTIKEWSNLYCWLYIY